MVVLSLPGRACCLTCAVSLRTATDNRSLLWRSVDIRSEHPVDNLPNTCSNGHPDTPDQVGLAQTPLACRAYAAGDMPIVAVKARVRWA